MFKFAIYSVVAFPSIVPSAWLIDLAPITLLTGTKQILHPSMQNLRQASPSASLTNFVGV